MGYIEKNLLFGEQVIYTTRLHPVVYAGAIAVALAAIPAAIMLPASEAFSGWKIAVAMFGVAVAWYAWCKIIVITSEFAVTSKRVLIKTGFVARDAFEMHLTRIEGVQIEQGLLGRMLNFGTVTVKGIGGSSDPFKNISRPLELRRAVVEAMGGVHGAGEGDGVATRSAKKTDAQSTRSTQEDAQSTRSTQGGDGAVAGSGGIDDIAFVREQLQLALEENRRLQAALTSKYQATTKVATATAAATQQRDPAAKDDNRQERPAQSVDPHGAKVLNFPKWEVPNRNNRGEIVE